MRTIQPKAIIYDESGNETKQETSSGLDDPPCSPLSQCCLCGRTDYPLEYGPRKNKLPMGSLVHFNSGEIVWICRRCSRDPIALARLEKDAPQDSQ